MMTKVYILLYFIMIQGLSSANHCERINKVAQIIKKDYISAKFLSNDSFNSIHISDTNSFVAISLQTFNKNINYFENTSYWKFSYAGDNNRVKLNCLSDISDSLHNHTFILNYNIIEENIILFSINNVYNPSKAVVYIVKFHNDSIFIIDKEFLEVNK